MKKRLFSRKVLAVLFSVSFLASCAKSCQKAGGPGGILGAKNDALDIIPADNNFLFTINWKRFIATPSFSDVMKDAPPEAKELSANVEEAVIALNLRGPSQAPSGLAVVNGSFDEKKVVSLLEDTAKKQGTGEIKKDTLEGHTIYLSPKDPNIGLVFLSSSQAMWGQIADLKEALALSAKKGNSIRTNKELMDLYSKRDSKKILWGTGLIPPSAAAPSGQPGDPMASLQGLKAFSLGVDYDNKDLSIDWTGYSQDASQAQNLVNLVNSYKSIFGASLAAQDPLWGQTIQGMQIGSQDKSVTISLKLSDELLKQMSQKLAAKAKEVSPPPGGAPAPAPGEAAPSAPPPSPSGPMPGAAPAAPTAPVAPSPPGAAAAPSNP